MSSSMLHTLFALLRARICAEGVPHDALHSPAYEEGHGHNGFPLHADLFYADRLLLVFDRVSRDSGASTLLSVDALHGCMERCPSMPQRARRRVRRLLELEATVADGFNEFFALLHGSSSWQADLADQLAACESTIQFRRGEGYLLNDRRWLHGRRAVRGAVATNRFHRLVYRSTDDRPPCKA